MEGRSWKDQIAIRGLSKMIKVNWNSKVFWINLVKKSKVKNGIV